jgi:3-methyl-2-oxobutanoate hydroxymethyltransferase
MKSIYTWAAKPAKRTITVGDLIQAKGKKKFTQVTANTILEAQAAEESGFDMIIGSASNVKKVREGSKTLFFTAALELHKYQTADEILCGAFTSLENGADAVMTPRSMEIVNMLAKEDVPVMGHLGLVPRKSTWIGGLRSVGKTAEEATELYKKFKRLEDAGAFSVEAEVIPENIMTEISKRTKLITVSLGSGKGADIMYLFMEDICGENETIPRHSKAYTNLKKMRQEIEVERVKALREFVKESKEGLFPDAKRTVNVDKTTLENFLKKIK